MSVSRRFAAGLSLSLLTLLSSGCSTPAPAEVAAPASVDELAKRSLARLDGEVRVPGLTAPVEIIRDQQGIPHIYARNDHDMFFAQGYVMAQDRLWQLEMWRRWREGRLAEIFGPAGLRVRRACPVDDVPRTVGREGVDELPPRRRAPVHRLGRRPERLRGPARRQPAGGVRAHRRRAREMDRPDRDAAVGRRRVSTAPAARRSRSFGWRATWRRSAPRKPTGAPLPTRGTTWRCPRGST